MKETKLKLIILFLLFFGKILIFFRIKYLENIGGLHPDLASTAIILILPTLATYITMFLKDLLSNIYISKEKKNNTKKNTKYVKLWFVILSVSLFIVYIIGFIVILEYYGNHQYPYEISENDLASLIKDFVKHIAYLETFLGIYLGIIIKPLIKKNEEKTDKTE